jgi:hypothetical protein
MHWYLVCSSHSDCLVATVLSGINMLRLVHLQLFANSASPQKPSAATGQLMEPEGFALQKHYVTRPHPALHWLLVSHPS